MPLPAIVRATGRTYRQSISSAFHAREALRTALALVLAGMALGSAGETARAQTIDCGQLRAQIAQAGRGGGRSGGSVRRQQAEIARTQAYAQQLGCGGGFSFFGGGDPRCGGLEQRIQQLQAGLAQIQAGGGGGRADLVARFNAYCRGGQPQPQQPRGFFESLFGGAQEEPRPVAPVPVAPRPDDGRRGDDDEGGPRAHGGSQPVCVRTCDGGFFPLGVSSRRSEDDLNEMCHTLCPGTETAVFTRNPNSEIDTAVGLDGKPYADLPNAMRFSKAFTPACSCLPAGKTWAQVLANADETIGDQHRGDILVTPEKSAEMSRPKLDPKTRTSLLQQPPATVTPEDAAKIAGDAVAGDPAANGTVEVTGPDGLKRTVRRVGPQQ